MIPLMTTVSDPVDPGSQDLRSPDPRILEIAILNDANNDHIMGSIIWGHIYPITYMILHDVVLPLMGISWYCSRDTPSPPCGGGDTRYHVSPHHVVMCVYVVI